MTTFLALLGWLLGLVLLGMGLLALFTLYTARKVASLLPPRGRFVDVPGARLHLREAGDGPPILMIHGLGAQLANYTYGLSGRLTDGFRVVAVDRPGSGHSVRLPGTGADLRTQAAAMAQLIGRLGLERPLVVGHSLGGAIALTLALEHPQQVGALALLAPLSHIQDEVPPVFKGLTIASPLARRLVAWTLAVPASIGRSRVTLEAVFGPEPVPGDYASRGGGMLTLRPSAFLAASSDLQALPDQLPHLETRWHEIRAPVSVLYGKDDRILDWKANGQALVDRLDKARLELIEGGHMLPVTNPDACARFIADAAARMAAPARINAAAG